MNNIPTLSQDFYQHLAKQATLEFSVIKTKFMHTSQKSIKKVRKPSRT